MASLHRHKSYNTTVVSAIIGTTGKLIGFLTMSKLTHPHTGHPPPSVGPVVYLHIAIRWYSYKRDRHKLMLLLVLSIQSVKHSDE